MKYVHLWLVQSPSKAGVKFYSWFADKLSNSSFAFTFVGLFIKTKKNVTNSREK